MTINDIPKDVLCLIFNYLDVEDLNSAGQGSRNLHQASLEERVWEKVAERLGIDLTKGDLNARARERVQAEWSRLLPQFKELKQDLNGFGLNLDMEDFIHSNNAPNNLETEDVNFL